jgi:hypothetical protein
MNDSTIVIGHRSPSDLGISIWNILSEPICDQDWTATGPRPRPRRRPTRPSRRRRFPIELLEPSAHRPAISCLGASRTPANNSPPSNSATRRPKNLHKLRH